MFLCWFLFRNHTLPIPRERLFYSYDDDLAPDEQNSLLSEGRLWLALQMYEEEREDEALAELRDLPQAIASYTVAQVIQRMSPHVAWITWTLVMQKTQSFVVGPRPASGNSQDETLLINLLWYPKFRLNQSNISKIEWDSHPSAGWKQANS